MNLIWQHSDEEKSQIQKSTHYVTPFIWSLKAYKTNQMWLSLGDCIERVPTEALEIFRIFF